jgi:hypothetical protein
MKPRRVLTAAEVAHAEALWRAGVGLDGLCSALAISRDVLIERRRPGDQLAHLAKRPAGCRRSGPRLAPPSPAEIAARAAEIRDGWSEVERLNRRAGPGSPVGSWVGERPGGRRVSARIHRNW